MPFLLQDCKLAVRKWQDIRIVLFHSKSVNVHLNLLSLQNLAGHTVKIYFFNRMVFASSLQKQKQTKNCKFNSNSFSVQYFGTNSTLQDVGYMQRSAKLKLKKKNKNKYCWFFLKKINKLWFNFLQRSHQD